MFYYIAPKGAQSIAINCLYVCLSVHLHTSKTTCPNFAKIAICVNCGHGLVLVWRQCRMSRTFCFVDDVTFSHNGANGAESKTTLLPGGGTEGRRFRSTVALCGYFIASYFS